MKYTRKQYINNECSHDEYHDQFVTNAAILRVKRSVGETRIVESKDEHFNDIPLNLWDSIGLSMETVRALRDVGDSYSLGGSVCINKAAARQIKQSHAVN